MRSEKNNIMRILTLTLFMVMLSFIAKAIEPVEQTNIYLHPGQGADERLFKNLEFSEKYCVNHLSLIHI